MLLSVLLAIIVTFVNLQHCPEIEKDSFQLKNESFVDLTNSTIVMEKDSEQFKNDSFNMNNSTDLLDKNLKIASKKLDILYFKKYQKKRCGFSCHDINKKNITITRKIPSDSLMNLLYTTPIKNRKRFCTLLWKCQM